MLCVNEVFALLKFYAVYFGTDVSAQTVFALDYMPLEDKTYFPKRRYLDTHLRCIKCHKCKDLIYAAAET